MTWNQLKELKMLDMFGGLNYLNNAKHSSNEKFEKDNLNGKDIINVVDEKDWVGFEKNNMILNFDKKIY
ncbi:hypothetical protein Glove_294g115 [Diversispora epigaea]|uniref:Uncharacterized protein n=1 Tax=Diversispora epigaea TaxID=1348612 RepID=A0A397HZ99_9GLOM|nr:hypothetical protein Glove_294g115 [Diversispora epigaea]